MRPEFPLCGEGSWDSLPTAGLCCWCYIASMRGRRTRRKESNAVVLWSEREEEKIQRKEEQRQEKRSPLSWLWETRQALHHTIIFCHRLPSNPKLLFAGGSFLTTRLGGGCCCYCCWPPTVAAIYCATLSSTVLKHDPHPFPGWHRQPVERGGGCVWVEEHAHEGLVVLWYGLCIVCSVGFWIWSQVDKIAEFTNKSLRRIKGQCRKHSSIRPLISNRHWMTFFANSGSRLYQP